MVRVLVPTALSLTCLAAAQAPQPARFDVVSVRRSGNNPMKLTQAPNGNVSMLSVSPVLLLSLSFGLLQSWQIEGVPGWARDERYDVIAVGDPNVPSPTQDQRQEMMRAMLADRFHLVTHFEDREVAGYELVLASRDGRLGRSLTPISDNCDAVRAALQAQRSPGLAPSPSPIVESPSKCTYRSARGRLVGDVTIDTLRQLLEGQIGSPIRNRTELGGYYRVDFSYRFEMSPSIDRGADVAGDGASLFTMVQEQLGLKLMRAKLLVPALVVDRIDRPTEN